VAPSSVDSAASEVWAMLVIGAAGLAIACVLGTLLYTVVRRIAADVRRLRGTPSKRVSFFWPGWAVSVTLALGIVLAPIFFGDRPRDPIAKAQADTRAMAAAIRIFAAHCGALPSSGGAKDCSNVTTSATGPSPLPEALMSQQTNAQGLVGGPFIAVMPSLPSGWTGTGNTYSYYTTPTGGFIVCATGDRTGANSDDGTTCP
jgi:hypothetical protein